LLVPEVFRVENSCAEALGGGDERSIEIADLIPAREEKAAAHNLGINRDKWELGKLFQPTVELRCSDNISKALPDNRCELRKHLAGKPEWRIAEEIERD
jgi:hypothetical protein